VDIEKAGHVRLASVLKRLIGERTTGLVLAGLTENKHGDRSNAIGKEFGYLKQGLGYGPRIVFHSIRKTLATIVEDAGVSENLTADILGHEKPRIAYGLYPGATPLATKAEAVAKLRHPAKACT
jgi:integrase